MPTPFVSVVLPVFNGERYIKKAVESILVQGFTDFELIIIDDGSSDSTLEVLQGFADGRIVLAGNKVNKGLVYSLNKGIDLAKGKYIARMDGDDLAHPDRFLKQLGYLEKNPLVGMLTTTAELINENDEVTGTWEDDVNHVTPASIRQYLPKNNCLVHPAMMGSATVFRQYRFRPEQSQAEDYDLWLRLAADGVTIHKLAEPLLKHRILGHSFTRKRQQNVFMKNARTKLRFVKHALLQGKINGFIFRCLVFGIIDLFMAFGKNLKSKLS